MYSVQYLNYQLATRASLRSLPMIREEWNKVKGKRWRNVLTPLVDLMTLTQVLVVRAHVKDGSLDPSLELGSREHVLDVLVVIDDYCKEGSEVQTHDLGTVFLCQFVEAYVSELEIVQQHEPVTSPHRQARRT